MNPNKYDARIAGWLYLVVVVTGIFSLAYVPSQTGTMERILASESLFRLGILSELINGVAFVLLPLVLYRLLHHVNKPMAVLMVAFAVLSVPISFVNVANKLDVLSLLGDADIAQVFTKAQVNALAVTSLDAYYNGLQVSKVFWGLWLLPSGYLIFKSGMLPRIFGVLLIMGCFGYLIDLTGCLLVSGYMQTRFHDLVVLPASIGEIGLCLWLVIMGAKDTARSGG